MNQFLISDIINNGLVQIALLGIFLFLYLLYSQKKRSHKR